MTRYLSILDLFNCSQLISEPTRITPTSSTVIDHVIVNKKDVVKGSGVLDGRLRDHLLTYVSRGMPKGMF